MPTFEYECRDCGAVTEVVEELQGGRIAARKCRACGGRRLKKVMSSFAYHPEITLEDLGVKMPSPQEMEQMQRQAPAQPTGPPPGGCPYENMEKEKAEKERKEKENPKFIM